jgi:hypothetical protein
MGPTVTERDLYLVLSELTRAAHARVELDKGCGGMGINILQESAGMLPRALRQADTLLDALQEKWRI